jgi:hypothetical protein
MRACSGYLGGLLVGTAISYEAPKSLVHNWWVWSLGVLLFAIAILWPEHMERKP